MNIKVNGKSYETSKLPPLGRGGEADVYKLGDNKALKIFKSTRHRDVRDNPSKVKAAKAKLDEAQKKLTLFPKNIPDQVVKPEALAFSSSGKVVGYLMSLVPDSDPLRLFGVKSFRSKGGVSIQDVVKLFIDIYQTKKALHSAKVVIGDDNDLNILVANGKAHYMGYFIDSDSFQFDKFLCMAFTQRFVDPILCDPNSKSPVLVKPYSYDSDWYAFNVQLMQSLLMLAGGPYGGVYQAKRGSTPVIQTRRPLLRLTVFDSNVIYPKAAEPLDILPDELRDYFEQVFVNDLRGEFPIELLQNMQQLPDGTFTTSTAMSVAEVRGKVKSTIIFSTTGVILRVAFQGGRLRWLYHEDGKFKREDGSVVSSGVLDRKMKYRISGSRTFFGRHDKMIEFSSGKEPSVTVVDSYQGKLPVFETNSSSKFWASHGELLMEHHMGSDYGAEKVGNILKEQTLFWAGDKLGFGFYQAGMIQTAFIFRPGKIGMNDSVDIPLIKGQIVDAECVSSSNRIWFMVAEREGGLTINKCHCIDEKGQILAYAEAVSDDGSWLGNLRGMCPIHHFLLASTDEGVVRVEPAKGTISVVQIFPDTEKFTDSESRLYPSSKGVFLAGSREIKELEIMP